MYPNRTVLNLANRPVSHVGAGNEGVLLLDMLNQLQIASHISSRSGNAEHLQMGNNNFYIVRDRFSSSYGNGGVQKAGMAGGKRVTFSTCALYRSSKHLLISRYLLANRKSLCLPDGIAAHIPFYPMMSP